MLDRIFREARTQNAWRDTPVGDETLQELYDLLKWAPTSMNCGPARFLFIRSPEAKQRLLPLMSPGNREKTRQAPVTVIVGYDLEFYEHLPKLFPHRPEARDGFAAEGRQAHAQETAFRNGSLQGGYLILAARALGLDCGPMSGFDAAAVDAEFWQGTSVRTNFICNIGYGDHAVLHQRLPRLAFDEACRLL
ncbi:3-hydroxypropanoate dehydrogenase [Parapusillimonas granuli]|uniref:Putative NADH dehydrogenase/NAD(P)H nitroreductase H0A72_02265 n=2 Tax=Parapusillimonas granuli TaxID=380911 RepID=A0A853FQT9_9BURK|nr:3-hydroxypropanoate dehydrogenase [Parapusillimonas granuli]NYT48125.1 malonic semialdehyde reductase [Parapusillimonas granuli]